MTSSRWGLGLCGGVFVRTAGMGGGRDRAALETPSLGALGFDADRPGKVARPRPKRQFLAKPEIVAYGVQYNRNRAEPVSDPTRPTPLNRLSAATVRSPCDGARRAKAGRERRIVDCMNGGLSMAEIAAFEGVSDRGMCRSVRALIARRCPEAAGVFIAVQVNRLNEAQRTSYGAMSETYLASVDGGRDRVRARPSPRLRRRSERNRMAP